MRSFPENKQRLTHRATDDELDVARVDIQLFVTSYKD